MNEILNEISTYLQAGKGAKVKELVALAIEEGIAPQEILENGLLAGMDIIGAKFKEDKVFVPEVLVAARAMNKGIEVLRPHLSEEGVTEKGIVILGTVEGDLHDIGKNLVKMMMEGKGLKVIDLGIDVPAQNFVQAAIENKANIIACSALLTTTMPMMKAVVDAVKQSSIANDVKIMIGGAPVTESFAKDIGADCYTADATSAARAALSFCVA